MRHPAHIRRAAMMAAILLVPYGRSAVEGGDLRINLRHDAKVVRVGVLNRWDRDGNATRPVDPKAKIDQPAFAATAQRAAPGRWIVRGLPAGRYDIVVLLEGRIRIDGFDFPPVLEFDPFLSHGATVAEDVRKIILEDIAKSRHYENKVSALYLTRDKHVVRVLVQLLRDKPTSYDGQYGEQVATMRHEVWQYTQRYGAWTKERRTRVFDRVLMPKRALRTWTWVWLPQLGGVVVDQQGTAERSFTLPEMWKGDVARGLLPY